MTIETKYHPGQSLFTFKDNKAIEVRIKRTEIEVKEGYGSDAKKYHTITHFASQKYRMFGSKALPYKEHELFLTKEALIQSL